MAMFSLSLYLSLFLCLSSHWNLQIAQTSIENLSLHYMAIYILRYNWNTFQNDRKLFPSCISTSVRLRYLTNHLYSERLNWQNCASLRLLMYSKIMYRLTINFTIFTCRESTATPPEQNSLLLCSLSEFFFC